MSSGHNVPHASNYNSNKTKKRRSGKHSGRGGNHHMRGNCDCHQPPYERQMQEYKLRVLAVVVPLAESYAQLMSAIMSKTAELQTKAQTSAEQEAALGVAQRFASTMVQAITKGQELAMNEDHH